MDTQPSRQATKAALQRLADDGSDLSKPMQIDFFVAVPGPDVGQRVGEAAAARGFAVSGEQDEESGDWTCYCTITVVPSVDRVWGLEQELDALARPLGGCSDGFGSYGNASD